jgi:HK97 family phage prohead protease
MPLKAVFGNHCTHCLCRLPGTRRRAVEMGSRSGLERSVWPARAVNSGVEVERSGEQGARMVGHFAVWDTWARIDSVLEGCFMERLSRGAFSKTFRAQGKRIKVLFQHGRDPSIGDKPLGSITELEEDQRGARYSVELLDVGYVRELIPALDARLFGASFRFRPLKSMLSNLHRLRQRTLKASPSALSWRPVCPSSARLSSRPTSRPRPACAAAV